MRHRLSQWELVVTATVLGLGVWLEAPGVAVAVVTSVVAAWGLLAAVRARRPPALVVASLAAVGAGVILVTSIRVIAVEQRWSDLREALVERAYAELEERLTDAVRLVESLAQRTAEAETASPGRVFGTIDRLVSGRGPEHGVVVFDATGRPWSWGGSLRVPPASAGPELTARMTPFYVLLEARRQAGSRMVVSQVLLAADSAVPDPGRTLAARFSRATGVAVAFVSAESAAERPDVLVFCHPACDPETEEPLVRAVVRPPSQGMAKLDLLAFGGRWTAAIALAVLVVLLVAGSGIGRVIGIVGGLTLFTLTAAGQHLGLASLFSSATYYFAPLGPFSASAGALLLFAGVVIVLLHVVVRWGVDLGVVGKVLAIVTVVASPAVLSWLAGGITPQETGTVATLWLSWQMPLAMVGVVLGLFASLLWGQSALARYWWMGPLAAVLAAGAAALCIAAWKPVSGWGPLYALVWIPPVGVAVLSGRRARLLLSLTAVSGAAAAILTWGMEVNGRLLLAQRDADRLSSGDPVAIGLLERFGDSLVTHPVPRSAAELYARWSRSPLSRGEAYPVALATWDPTGRRVANLELAELVVPQARIARLALRAHDSGEPVSDIAELDFGIHYLAAVPFPDSSVVTIAVGPRSRLIEPVAVALFLRGERRIEEPYELSLGEVVIGAASPSIRWIRARWMVRGTRTLDLATGTRHLHVDVRLRNFTELGVRGVLLVLLNVGMVGVLAILGAAIRSGFKVPAAVVEALRFRSYRIRLAVALAGFFVLPTIGFAVWSVGQIQANAGRSRDLLIQQTLRDAAAASRRFQRLQIEGLGLRLRDLSARVGADVIWYEGGVLAQVGVPILAELGLLGTLLPPGVYRDLWLGDAIQVNANRVIGGQLTRVGYRVLQGTGPAAVVLAAPSLVDVADIQQEQENLVLGVLLVTLLGLAGAAGLAAFAARSLARPVQSLRVAAEAVGRGDHLASFGPDVPTEFVSVVEAFERMARDVEASQAALEAARRRTATVLANVATGVIALDHDLRITIANPRAAEMLGTTLPSGELISDHSGGEWAPVWEWVTRCMAHGTELDAREFSIGQQRIRAQVADVQTDPRGCVIALDDTTELARAVRVLAWGELAQQIAHEIKNPLTPIRLGVQHIRRARRDGSADFDSTLELTSRQILAEIERLDAIARSFARFGAPPAEAAPLAEEDLVGIAKDAAQLYAVGERPSVQVVASGPVRASVRRDEVKEVLVNVVENARDAQARSVTISLDRQGDHAIIEVRDDGCGITSEHLARVFEPQFSTTSSGTGLGLAICRRLVEGWGGTIEVQSVVGEGTVVRIRLGEKR